MSCQKPFSGLLLTMGSRTFIFSSWHRFHWTQHTSGQNQTPPDKRRPHRASVYARANSWNTALRVTCMSAGGEGNACVSDKTRSKSALAGFPWKLYIAKGVPCSPTDFSLLSCQCCRGVVVVVVGNTRLGPERSPRMCVWPKDCVTEHAFVLELKCLCCEPQFVHPPTLPAFPPEASGTRRSEEHSAQQRWNCHA